MSKRKMSLKELDFNNIGSWPREYRIGFCILAGLLIFGLLWWVLTRDKGDELKSLESRESELRAGDPADFPDRANFVNLKTAGQLVTPAETAARVVGWLARANFGETVIGDVREA